MKNENRQASTEARVFQELEKMMFDHIKHGDPVKRVEFFFTSKESGDLVVLNSILIYTKYGNFSKNFNVPLLPDEFDEELNNFFEKSSATMKMDSCIVLNKRKTNNVYLSELVTKSRTCVTL